MTCHVRDTYTLPVCHNRFPVALTTDMHCLPLARLHDAITYETRYTEITGVMFLCFSVSVPVLMQSAVYR